VVPAVKVNIPGSACPNYAAGNYFYYWIFFIKLIQVSFDEINYLRPVNSEKEYQKQLLIPGLSD
jgi:hypothetical protein